MDSEEDIVEDSVEKEIVEDSVEEDIVEDLVDQDSFLEEIPGCFLEGGRSSSGRNFLIRLGNNNNYMP